MQFRARHRPQTPAHLALARLDMGLTTMLLTGIWMSSAGAAEPCTGAIGQWSWFIGGQVTVAQGGQARWTPATASIPPASGTWTCDPKVGKYVVTWQNGFVDTLSLSPDRTKLTGTSSTGAAVSGWRGGAAAGTAPVRPPPTGAIDHNPSVSEILKGRPKPDPRGWIPGGNRPPQKGPKPFEGW